MLKFTIAAALVAAISAIANPVLAEVPAAAHASAPTARPQPRVSRLRSMGSGEIRVDERNLAGVVQLGEPIIVVGRVAKPAVFIYIERAEITWDELQMSTDFASRIAKDARLATF